MQNYEIDPQKEIKQFEQAKNAFTAIKAIWDELAFFYLPTVDVLSRYHYIDSNTGKQRRLMFDSTPEQTIQESASKLQIILCNPEQKFFKIKIKIDDLEKSQEFKTQLEAINKACLEAINDPLANFYEQVRDAIIKILTFGIGGILIDEDTDNDGVKFKSIGLQNYYYTENFQGLIVCHYFEEIIKSSELYNIAEKLGYDIAGLDVEKDNDKKTYTIIRKIYLNPNYNPNVISFETAKWQEIFFEQKHKKILKQDFYHDCPVAIGRWSKVTNSIFPDSLGRLMLAESKSLNRLEQNILEIAEQNMRPAYTASADFIKSGVDLSSHSINIMLDPSSTIKPIEQGDVNIIPYLRDQAEQKRQRIKAGFYLDMFSNIADANAGDYTATEAMIRDRNALKMIAPKVTHLQAEFISGIVKRVASIILKKQLTGMPAEDIKSPSLDNWYMKIAYESEVSTSYRLNDLNNYLSFIQNAGGIATTEANLTGQASSIDNVNFDEIMKEVMKIMNLNQSVMRSEEEVQTIREAKQQQAQQQAEMMQAQQQSEIAKNIPKEAYNDRPST